MSDDESRIVMMMQIHCVCIIDDANTLCLHHDSVSMTVVDILIAYYCLLLLVITTCGYIPKKTNISGNSGLAV